MGIVHFLNVNEGDCQLIEHATGHDTVIDVCNASSTEDKSVAEATVYVAESLGVSGNFNQKANPTNPVDYLKGLGIGRIFRYVQSHPDMDHMDGIQDLFDEFSPVNFWDTNNTKEQVGDFGQYKKSDWEFYKSLRSGSDESPKRLTLYDGAKGAYYNEGENGEGGGDGLQVLAPTPDLLKIANDEEDWNDASYVILYKTNSWKILFCGDSHDDTWEHLLSKHKTKLKDIDVLIAPHHGRDSGADFSFLDTLKPTLTLFGNAKSKHLAYDKWSSRGLSYVTNNQAGNIILDPDQDQHLRVYVSCEAFARAFAAKTNSATTYSQKYDAWFLLAL